MDVNDALAIAANPDRDRASGGIPVTVDERYPENAKVSAAQVEIAAVRDFLEAVTSDGIQLCRNEDVNLTPGMGRHIAPRWMPQDWQPIVCAHFGIDEQALERERRAMLANLGVSQ